MTKQRFRPSPLRWYRWGLLLLFVLGGVWLLWASRAILTPFVFALVLTYLLAPMVQAFVWHGKINRVLAILTVYALVGFLVAMAVLYIIPLLVQESVHLIHMVPGFVRKVQVSWDYWLAEFHEAPMPQSIKNSINQTGTHLESQLFMVLKSIVTASFGLVPGFLSLLISPVLAFYLLKDLDHIRQRFWTVVPVPWQAAVFKLGYDVDRALNGYIRGQFIVAVVVGFLSGLWTFLLGIPFAALIGVLAGVTDIIPYVGPLAGALPAVLLGLTRSPWVAGYAVVGFIMIHQLEGTVIAPKVVGDSVGLHPLVVVFAILAGGDLAGMAGLLLGVPFAAVLKVIVTHLYRRLVVTLDRHPSGSVQ